MRVSPNWITILSPQWQIASADEQSVSAFATKNLPVRLWIILFLVPILTATFCRGVLKAIVGSPQWTATVSTRLTPPSRPKLNYMFPYPRSTTYHYSLSSVYVQSSRHKANIPSAHKKLHHKTRDSLTDHRIDYSAAELITLIQPFIFVIEKPNAN